MNIADILGVHRSGRPGHPAVESGKRTISYGLLATLTDACAARMRKRGIHAGDVIAVNLPDGIEYLVVLYALAKIGAIAFPLAGNNPALEQRRLLLQSGAKLLVETAAGTLSLNPIPTLAVTELCPGDDETGAASADQVSTAGFDADSPLIIVSSSGTSAAAKLMLLTHAQMHCRITTRDRYMGFTPDDRYLSLIKLSFNLGRIRCMRAIQDRATVVFPVLENGERFIGCLRRNRITITNMMPNQVRKAFGELDASEPCMNGMRLIIGSSPVTAEDRLRIRRAVTPHLYEVYAATEIGPISVATPADQDAQPQSVGRVVDEVEAQVVDDGGRVLPAGEVGVVRFRAPALPTAYLGNPQATARAFRDGWFYPGDLGSISGDGYIFLKGREDDVINNEGAKFYPQEVEEVLLAHPSVVEAAVLGFAHPAVGQTAVACVVTNAKISARELKDFCSQRIAAFKVPYAILFLDTLPRNPAGKISKRELDQVVQEQVKVR